MNIPLISKTLINRVGYPIAYNGSLVFAIKHALLGALALASSKGLVPKKGLYNIVKSCSNLHTFRTPFGIFEADTWDAWMRFYPTYEQSIRDIILDKREDHLKSGNNVVINIGANVGRWTVELAKMGYDVLAFEPIPRVFSKLQKNIALSEVTDKVSAFNFALGADAKEEIMHVFRFHEGASYLDDVLSSYTLDLSETFRVPVVPFDNIRDLSHDVTKRTSIVIIDVEGYELYALKGMSHFIDAIDSIDFFIEIHPTSKFKKDTILFMDEHGFVGEQIDDKNNWHFHK